MRLSSKSSCSPSILAALAQVRCWREPPLWPSIDGMAGNCGTADRDLRSRELVGALPWLPGLTVAELVTFLFCLLWCICSGPFVAQPEDFGIAAIVSR